MSAAEQNQTPLSAHLDGLVQQMVELVPSALTDFDADAIHKSRVATRRMKAALNLLRPQLTEEHAHPIDRLGKRLRRRLGPLRDLDVMLGHLDEIQIGKLQPAVAWLRERLENDRQHQRKRIAKKSPPVKLLIKLQSWPALRYEVIAAEPAVGKMIAESLHLQLDQFAEQADRLGGGADPHQLRIAGKSLRYTLEMGKATGVKSAGSLLRHFKRMQDTLGLWHDFVVLAKTAMQASLNEDLPLHDTSLQRQVLELIDHSMKRAKRQLDQFVKVWADEGPKISAEIRTMFPLAEIAAVPEVASEPKTDPDPVDSAPPEEPAPAEPVQPPVV